MPVDYRHGLGQRLRAVSPDEIGIRGPLHYLGHQIMTVSLLADSLQADGALSADAQRRLELVMQEAGRALEMITTNVLAESRAAVGVPARSIDVRELADQVAQLVRLVHQTTVRLLPGPPAYVQVDSMTMWRVLCNLIDNAARAAGPTGQVDICIRQDDGTIIEVSDDGHGFGKGEHGLAGLGLCAVTQLIAACGGQFELLPRKHGGTIARAAFGS